MEYRSLLFIEVRSVLLKLPVLCDMGDSVVCEVRPGWERQNSLFVGG